MSKSSAFKNYIYSTLYKVLTLLTPLITAPYLARVIGTEGVGAFSYCYSIAYIFSLVAKLGLMNYGSRSIAQARDDKKRLQEVFSGIYNLQLITTAISTVLYIIFAVFGGGEYKEIFFINIFFVIGVAIDIDWLYYGLEKFKLTAVRNSIIKILTVVAILAFVKTKEDLPVYALIMGLSEFLKYLSIWVSFGKNTKLVKVNSKQIFKHLKPTVILFIPVIATSIYRNMDKIMLGSMSTMSQTGIYENSEKIVFMLLGFVTSLEMVMMPKISNLVENGRNKEALDNIYKSMIFVSALTSAMAFGIGGIAEKFIPFFYGEAFSECARLLPFLSIDLCFIGWANVIRTQYIVPKEKDKFYVYSTILGAVINLIINFTLIPKYGAKGAAIGTIAAEFTVALFLSFVVRKELPLIKFIKKTVAFPVIGVVMSLLVHWIGGFLPDGLVGVVVQVIVGGTVYIALSGIYIVVFQRDLFKQVLGRLKR